MKRTIKLLFLFLILAFTYSAHAQETSVLSPVVLSPAALSPTVSPALSELQTSWAVANYQLEDKAQISAFETLIQQADQHLSNNPNDANIQIWTGIIKSTFAGVKGGLGALGLAKAAKIHLEAAIELDDQALNGSAYTSLGTLYANVPSWPIGFGNKKQAVKFLKKALEINPDGIDSNYFYAEFLLSKKKVDKAKNHYQKALAAEPRAGREIADQGRRKEIQTALNELSIQ